MSKLEMNKSSHHFIMRIFYHIIQFQKANQNFKKINGGKNNEKTSDTHGVKSFGSSGGFNAVHHECFGCDLF
jgi:hypothetical protein